MKKSVAIIGGGTAGLFAASFLDVTKYEVTIYEKNKALGRKFLVAGKGGFNLSHSEEMKSLKTKYHPPTYLDSALDQFSNEDLRNFFESIGVSTYIGSSGRIFPIKGKKPVEVLNALKEHLDRNEVIIKYEMQWTGWNDEQLLFNEGIKVKSDIVIFALGGASWKVTGSDGQWSSLFENEGIEIKKFKPSNCAFSVDWPKEFIGKYEGKPLKNIAIQTETGSTKGEAVITKFGLEGNALYPHSQYLNSEIESAAEAMFFIDLKPNNSYEEIEKKVKLSSKNTTNILRDRVKLDATKLALIKAHSTKEEYTDHNTLIELIKRLPITTTSSADMDEAISTYGGVSLSQLTPNFELHKRPNHYCIGEMIDWDTRTGGYLIQGCASMGVFVAKILNEK